MQSPGGSEGTQQEGAATAYALPFRFLYTPWPHLSLGKPAVLDVVLKREPAEPATSNLDSLVTTFYMLASTGALSGDAVHPAESNVGHPSRPERDRSTLQWRFPSTNIAQAAIPILAQLLMLATSEVEIERAVLTCQGSSAPIRLAENPALRDWYPAIWENLSFDLSLSGEIGKSAMLGITASRLLSEEDQQRIEVELLTWVTATQIGAYGVAPIAPDRCGIFSDRHVTFLGSDLELSFFNIRCHPAAFRGLVNVCTKIAESIVPL